MLAQTLATVPVVLFGIIFGVADTDSDNVVQMSCQSCPYKSDEQRSAEIIEAEEKIRKDLFHEKLKQAFKELQPDVLDGQNTDFSGEQKRELPDPILTGLRDFRASRLDSSESEKALLHRIYLMGEAFLPSHDQVRRNSRGIKVGSCEGTLFTSCINLTFPANFEFSRIRKAKLWLYPNPPMSKLDGKLTFQEIGPGMVYQSHNTQRVQSSPLDKGWIKVDLTDMMKFWQAHTKNKSESKLLGISNGEGSITAAVGDAKRPYVEVELTQHLLRRKREPIRNEDCPKNAFSFCCRKPLLFNFTEYNYTFVTFPKDGIDIGYCSGHCRVIRKERHLLLANEAAKEGAVIYPCCTPKNFSHAFLQYKYQNTYKTGKIPNLIVDSCHCEI